MTSTPANRRRPNIVLIQSDSMDGRVMGCAGHPAMGAATPNLDVLAAGGVLFEQAYTNNPICCPCRASMFSGLYTHNCEGWNNYKGLEPDDPTFLTRLADAGYVTQTFGKTDYLSGHHTFRARVSAWTRSAGIHRPQYRTRAPEVKDTDEARVHVVDWVDVDRSIAWLGEAAAADQPFMLYLGIRGPHPPFVTSHRYLDMIDPAGITLPAADEAEHPAQEYMRLVKNWEHGYSDEMVREVRSVYFAMIAEVDAMVGAVTAALDELGLRDSTYVIYTSDHGEMAMEHRQHYKMTLYESSARVPLIISGPEVQVGERVTAPASLVDIHPTLMDMAGTDQPALDGHSLMAELADGAGDRPDWVFSECHDSGCITGAFMLRRGENKYIAYPGYEPQLFNLNEDPDEVRNLAADRPEVVAEMDKRLREIVDYEAVDAKAKTHDRASFAQWRDERKAAGDYEEVMARIFSGWGKLAEDDILPWTEEDEAIIEKWSEV